MHWPQGKKEDGTVYDGPPDGPTFNDVWEEMEKLLETKQVRAIGVSNFSHKTQTAKVRGAAVQHDSVLTLAAGHAGSVPGRGPPVPP
jgi:glycerol 2-dehydrogenase (NADP+)